MQDSLDIATRAKERIWSYVFSKDPDSGVLLRGQSEGGCSVHDAHGPKAHRASRIAPTLRGTESKRQHVYPHHKDCCNTSKLPALAVVKTAKLLEKIPARLKLSSPANRIQSVPSPARSAGKKPSPAPVVPRRPFLSLHHHTTTRTHHPPHPPRPSPTTVTHRLRDTAVALDVSTG